MADAGRPTEPERRPDGDAPEGFLDLYAEAHQRFPQERRGGGAARPITLLDVHQDSQEMVDPATPDLVMVTLLEGDVRHAEFDVGDGFAPGSDRPGMMQVLPVGAEMANRVEGPHRVLALATPWAGLAELLAADGAGDDDPFRALVGRAIDEPAADALMRRLWREAGRDAVAASLSWWTGSCCSSWRRSGGSRGRPSPLARGGPRRRSTRGGWRGWRPTPRRIWPSR